MKHISNIFLLFLCLLNFQCKQDSYTDGSISNEKELIVVAEDDLSGTFQLFTRDIDGSNPKQLTFNQSKSSQPSISPNGGEIAYIVEGSNSVDIYIINTDGTGNHKITNAGINITPCWTPDGNYILFAYAPMPDPNIKFRIYKIKKDGTEKTVLVNDLGDFSEYAPTISEKANQVAFTSTRSGNAKYEIWKANLDGSSVTRLTMSDYDSDIQANIEQKVPSWSPDGTKIALWRGIEMDELRHDGSDRDQKIYQSWKICVMNSDGSNLTAVDFGDDPTWTNDSKYILHPDPANRDQNLNGQISVKRHLPDGSNNITYFKTGRNFGRMDVGYKK